MTLQVALGRRPTGPQSGAFGHVDLNATARAALQEMAESVVERVGSLEETPYHPDDQPEPGEVLVGDLDGVDGWFQPNAEWSLERTVGELRSTGSPPTLANTELAEGRWTFYGIGTRVGPSDVVLIRGRSPRYGLTGANKLMTIFVANELRPVEEPLMSFDYEADAVVIGDYVYFMHPRAVERLFIDAEAVKDRAPATVDLFSQNLQASLTTAAMDSLVHACSNNANIARRVERLNREGTLARVTTAEVRAALPAAGRNQDALGTPGQPLNANTDDQARLLIDIAADLYYQPRFDEAPRRVSTYRRMAS